jgi:hypothetical protein
VAVNWIDHGGHRGRESRQQRRRDLEVLRDEERGNSRDHKHGEGDEREAAEPM